MKPETLDKISKDFDRLENVDFVEGETLTVKDAIDFMKAGIVYELYEVDYSDDEGVTMVREYANALETLSTKNPADKVSIYWHPMGAFVIKDESEEY